MNAIRPVRGVFHSVRDGRKTCSICRVEKPVEDFYPKKIGGWESRCKACKKALWNTTPRSDTLAERFWPKVDKDQVGTGCWEWTKATNPAGYGVMWVGGKPPLILAHRLSLMLAGVEVPFTGRKTRGNGSIGEYDIVDHLCKNHTCVYPGHLRLVSQRVNTLEEVDSPFARNARKVACIHGHPLSGANLAIAPYKGRRGGQYTTRVCLTCYPERWMYAVEERVPPERARVKVWLGPATKTRI